MRKSSRVGPTAVCLAWALLACGAGAPLTDAALEGGVDAADASSAEASSADAGSPEASSADAVVEAGADGDVDASACTTVREGATVTSTVAMVDSPTPTGGVLAPGDYQLVSAVAYVGAAGTAPTPRVLSGALRFGGGSMELSLTERGATTAVSGSYSAAGTSVSFTFACPRAAPARSYPYNASSAAFEWYLPPNLLLRFARQ